MAEKLVYPRILYIAQHPFVTPKQLANLLAKHIVPASSWLSNIDISRASVTKLIQTIDSLSLHFEALESTYFEVNVLKSIQDYEWLLLDKQGAKLIAAPIKGYNYQPNTDVAVHHYIAFGSPTISIPYENVNSILIHELDSAKNLSELSSAAAELINAHRPGSLRRTRIKADAIIRLPLPLIESKSLQQQPAIIKPSSRELTTVPTTVFDLYFSTVLQMHDYLQSHVANLTEQYSGHADLEYRGLWSDSRVIIIQAFRLTSKSGNGGWKVRGAIPTAD